MSQIKYNPISATIKHVSRKAEVKEPVIIPGKIQLIFLAFAFKDDVFEETI